MLSVDFIFIKLFSDFVFIISRLERAKEKGKSTGLVSTAELTDATPAAYAAHVTSRDDKNCLLLSTPMAPLYVL
jgi:hypothetical protein